MIKIYCDCCGVEIDRSTLPKGGVTNDRLAAKVKSKNGCHVLGVEVITRLDNTANAGDFCKNCILDALYKLDDRQIKCVLD